MSISLVSKREVEEIKSKKTVIKNPDNEPEPWEIEQVDLVDWESNVHGFQREYTRERLSRLAGWRDCLMQGQIPPTDALAIDDLKEEPEPQIVWKCPEGEDANHRTMKIRAMPYYIKVTYLTTVEMIPEKQNPGTRDRRLDRMFAINKPGRRSLSVPFMLESKLNIDQRSRDHLRVDLLPLYMENINHVQVAWNLSLEDRMDNNHNVVPNQETRVIDRIFQSRASTMMPIRKIVCFGMGYFLRSKLLTKDPDSSFVTQYLLVFHIANVLRDMDPERRPVQIVMQDPLYAAIDFQIIRQLYRQNYNAEAQTQGLTADYHSHLTFADDPDGLLAIDDTTLVFAPFLPNHFPLYQIIADMAQPAAIMTDAMSQELNVDGGEQRRMWHAFMRGSPRVARFLGDYDRVHFDDVQVQRELYDTFCSDPIEEGIPYWLWEMEMWVRRRPDANTATATATASAKGKGKVAFVDNGEAAPSSSAAPTLPPPSPAPSSTTQVWRSVDATAVKLERFHALMQGQSSVRSASDQATFELQQEVIRRQDRAIARCRSWHAPFRLLDVYEGYIGLRCETFLDWLTSNRRDAAAASSAHSNAGGDAGSAFGISALTPEKVWRSVVTCLIVLLLLFPAIASFFLLWLFPHTL